MTDAVPPAPIAPTTEVAAPATETPVTEPVVTSVEGSEAPAEETPKEPELSATKRFEQAARREKAALKRVKAEREALEARKHEVLTKERERIKSNPLEVLTENGYDLEAITQLYLKNLGYVDPNEASKPDYVEPAVKRIQSLEEKIAAKEKEEKERYETQVREQQNLALQNHLTNVFEYCKKEGEKYEVIISHPNEGISTYQSLLTEFANQMGRIATDDEIVKLLDRTEQLLEKQETERFQKLLKLKKFAPYLKTQAAEPENKTPQEQPVSKPKTLTNSLVTNAPSKPIAANVNKRMSPREIEAARLQAIAEKYDSKR